MNEENKIRDYLLGRMPEPDSEAIETQALTDDDFYLNLRGIEDDLFDAFARGELGADDRTAFLQRYGGQSDRISFARALAGRRSNVVALPVRRWVGWAAAAAILVTITALVVRSPHPTTLPVTVARRPAVRSIAVAVALGGSRSGSAPVQVILPNDVSMVDLRVRLNPEDRYDRYAVELRSRSSHWRGDDLHAIIEGGDLIVTAAVPASALQDGTYELAISGGGQDLGFVTLEVRYKR